MSVSWRPWGGLVLGIILGSGLHAQVASDEADRIVAWNAALLAAVRAESTPPPLAVRNLAIVHLVLADMVCPTEGADRGRSQVLLPIGACAVASSLYPSRRAEFERLRDDALTAVEPQPSSAEWMSATRCAADALRARESDGASRSVTYIPGDLPGDWRRTPPYFRPPELPQWRHVRPFVIGDPDHFVPAGPPPLTSTVWKSACDEIEQLGARNSTMRTADQTLCARFWSDFSYTTTPPGHWNEIAADVARRRGMGARETARMFAVLNLAMADAGIVCWETKYRYNTWRPVTALAARDWQPLLATPAHPEYPSGHSAFSGAAAAVLAVFAGSDQCEFTVRSDAVPGAIREFHSFSDAAVEISLSRVYGGIHFRFSCDDGLKIGRSVAAEVLARSALSKGPRSAAEVALR